MNFDTIHADLQMFDSWEDRYAYIIDLGRQLPTLPDADKTDDHLVPGCVSKVWLLLSWEGDALAIRADSDAIITRGLVALLIHLYCGKTADKIVAIDSEAIFAELQLAQHLSPSRANGFANMLHKIKTFAEPA